MYEQEYVKNFVKSINVGKVRDWYAYEHSAEKYYKTRSDKKIREINSFVTFLVKTSISRKNVGFFRKIRDCVL